MKWLAFAALLLFAGFLGGDRVQPGRVKPLADFVIGLGFAAVPVAVGIGVLRYRLYEIDRVISRTLSFALVTAALGTAYVGLVLLGQGLFSSVAGGGGLVVAVSTLVVAALFLPCGRGCSVRRPAVQPAPVRRTEDAGGIRDAAA